MKLFFIAAALISITTAAFAQANTALSNLTSPTSVNLSMIPSANNSINLGSATIGWKNIYLKGSVYIGGDKFIDNPISGGHNTAIGLDVLNSVTSGGIDNTGAGFQALYYNTTGSTNTAIGKWALFSNETGFDNTASGDGALSGNSVGNYNSATGSLALSYNTSGEFNTGIGFNSLYYATTGDYNTACGYNAGYNVQTGGTNTFLGYNANCGSSGTLTNSTAIGANALVTTSNTIRMGNANVTSIGGFANWSNVSDGRVKKNVIENVPGLAFIRLLKPISYSYDLDAANKILHPEAENQDQLQSASSVRQVEDHEKENIIYSGFLAQDVEDAAQKIGYTFSGIEKPTNANSLYELRYAEFVVPLVKAVQELAKQRDDLEAKNQVLRIQNDDLDRRITALENKLSVNSNK